MRLWEKPNLFVFDNGSNFGSQWLGWPGHDKARKFNFDS
jgi:hypothetical protein